MMIDDLDVWVAALRGGHGMICGLDFVELLRDSIQRDAVIVIAAENHIAADARPRLPQAVPQLFDARLNLMSELVRAHLQSRQLLLFIRHGHLSCLRGYRMAMANTGGDMVLRKRMV
jgi:hypothetical protein